MQVRLSMIAVPKVLYLAEDGGIHLLEILELIEKNGEMPLQRLFHNHFKQVAETADLAVNLNVQLLLDVLLELLAKHGLTVFRDKEIGDVFPFQSLVNQ